MKKKKSLLFIVFIFFFTINTIKSQTEYGKVAISEVYFDTYAIEDQGYKNHHAGEFIELFNSSTEAIDISGWKIEDNVGSFTIPANTVIASGGFKVITFTSSKSLFTKLFPEAFNFDEDIILQRSFMLNNNVEKVHLLDTNDELISDASFAPIGWYSRADLKNNLEDLLEKYNFEPIHGFEYLDNSENSSFNGAIPIFAKTGIRLASQEAFYGNGNNSSFENGEARPFELHIPVKLLNPYDTGEPTDVGNIPITLPNENYIHKVAYQVPVKENELSGVSSADKIQNVTYFDSLGRPMQNVAIQNSKDREDIITHIEYDDFGRQDKEYLPYVNETDSTDSGAIQTGDVGLAAKNYYENKYPDDFLNTITTTDVNAYSKKGFDNSPLNRVIEQAAPGEDWKLGDGHGITFEYDTNTSTEVKLYSVTISLADSTYTPTLELDTSVNSGNYNIGELYKTITKDENWTSGLDHTTEEFKNKQGQVVLKRTYNSQDPHDTYYVYDDYGNLTYVLPPLMDVSQISISGIRSKLNDFGYQYKYDYRNRLIEKKIPGKGWEYIVYDKLDRPILTQDAVQEAKIEKEWLYIKYDVFGRVVYTGLYKNNSNRATIQASATTHTATYEQRGTTHFNYTNDAYPTGISLNDIYVLNYYDDYQWDISGGGLATTDLTYDSSKLSFSNGTITKNGPDASKGWNAGFISNRSIQGDGFIEYTVTQSAFQDIIVGLSKTSETLNDSYSTIDYGIYTGSGSDNILRILEEGQYISISNYFVNIGDVFKVERIGSRIEYKQNGNVFYTSSKPSAGELIGDAAFYRRNATLYNVNIGGGTDPGTTDSAKGLATGSRVKVLGTNSWITTVSYYDEKARPIYVYAKNDYLLTTDILMSNLDFVGKVLNTSTTHTKTDDNLPTITTVDTFEYDHVGRFKKQTQFGTAREGIEVISSNTYDALGQLESKGVGGKTTQSRLQTIDYKYNVRGWLKTINADENNDNDLFNFTLRYNSPTSGEALYNGNISQSSWSSANTDPSTKTYTYSYDALNRIIGAVGDATGNYNLGGYDSSESLISPITYDKNGNILNLQRNGHLDNTTTPAFGIMDNLAYDYDGNKLLKVDDTGSAPIGVKGQFKDGNTSGIDYRYDANGNMVMDLNKGIGSASVDGIIYNHLNLPTKVTIQGKEINYVYDASGIKLLKSIERGSENEATFYAGNYIYKKEASRGTPAVLQFFNQPEGYVQNNNGTFKYVYQYKDHLGNVRLSYADSNNDGEITVSSNPNETEIVEESNYYPFGLKHKGYNSVTNPNGNSTAQKFGFGGKELQDDVVGGNSLDWHDFGARNYDASLGRWMNLDPLAEQMRRHSPYNYAFDNPIYWIDPDGMKPEDDYFNKKGEYLGSDNAKTDNLQIVSQKDWDANKTVDKNGKGSISQEKGAEISTNITETEISDDAVENVVEHYNNQLDDASKKDGVDIKAKVVTDPNTGKPDKSILMRSETGGGGEIFGIRYGESNDINVNTANDGKVHPELGTASNIKNTLVHEHVHQKGVGSESRAVKVQKGHSSYKGTTKSYKKLVNNYGKKHQKK
jgi:RHS repeat-associated protein